MDNKCPKCNAPLEDNYNFCPICGEPLNDLARQSESLNISNAIYAKVDKIISNINDPAVLQLVKKYFLED